MKPKYLLLVALLGIGAGSEYPKPNSKDFTEEIGTMESRLQAPAGYAKLVDRPELVGGYYVNFSDAFYYAGDTLSFQKFLDQYSKLTNVVAHTVIKCRGTSIGGPPWNRSKFGEYSWALYSHPCGASEPKNYPFSKDKFVVWIELRLGGLIREKEANQIIFPPGVQVLHVHTQ